MSRISFLILLIAFGLRIVGLETRGIWLDEFTSLEVATKNLYDMIFGTGFNWHTPPFYYIASHYWLLIFPDTAWGLRSFSLLADLLSIWASISIFGRQFGKQVGYRVGLLLAISPYAIYYAQEGRMYSLLQLEVLLTYGILQSFSAHKKNEISALAKLVIIGTIGMYTHYYYAFFLLGTGLWTLFSLRNSKQAFWKLFAAFVIVGILFLPWLRVLFEILASEGQSFRRFVFAVIPYTVFRFSAGYAIVPLELADKSSISQTLTESLFSILLYLTVFITASLVSLKLRSKELDIMWPALFFPPIFALLISLLTPMLSERYLIVSFPFFIVLLALLLESKSKLHHTLFAAVLILSAFGTWKHYTNPNFGNTQWREAAAVIKESTCKTVLVNPDYCLGLLQYYLTDDYKVISKPEKIDNNCTWLVERGTASPVVLQDFSLEKEYWFPLENGVRLSSLKRLQN